MRMRRHARNVDGAQDHSQHTHRNVDIEDPLPTPPVDQQATGNRAHQSRDPGHRPPHPHGGSAPLWGKHSLYHCQCLRRQHRRAEPLHYPGSDKPSDRSGEPAPQGGGGENRQPRQVHGLRAELIPEPPGDQQRHRVTQQIGAGDPHRCRVVGTESGLDGGIGDRHDGRVEQDHEQSEKHHPQRRPRSRIVLVYSSGIQLPLRWWHGFSRRPTPPGPAQRRPS